ncbi:unnamed protein product [Darwinula stevensoni]|uniref:Gustatory receptor n=1 Tax=Darwinula stevensoni TaxID=69355 RepID=A0A7R9A3R0_9CRUS|nr:unnamed protein product [Darwinula stevensoni]CAG0891111.1 unnamed protein product [Darwinula stevensoni]
MFLGILPVQRTGNETKKVTFRFWSFPFFWSLLIISAYITSMACLVPLFQKYADRYFFTLADRIGSYVMVIAGCGSVLTYVSSQTMTARKLPSLLEDLDATWKGVEPLKESCSAAAHRRSFLFTVIGSTCFYLGSVSTCWSMVQGFSYLAPIACFVLCAVVEAGIVTLFLIISLSCQVLKTILEERARELRCAEKPLRRGEALALYLDTHLRASRLCRRLSSAFHPTLFLSFLTDIAFTVLYAFFIISYAMKGYWLMAGTALAKALFCDFLVFSLCRTADSLSSKAEEIILALTNDETLSLDRKSRNQVVHFEAQTRTHQVKLQASGYFTLDKALLTSVASNMLTYLIVLLEFRVE